MDEKAYWLGFSVFSGIGPVKFALLLAFFGSAKAAWDASLTELKNSKIGNSTAEKLDEFRGHFSIADYAKKVREKKVQIITLKDKEYPPALVKIKNPPFLLYVKGDAKNLTQKKMIAIVGTRKITQYGQQVTGLMTRELVQEGWTIVSGLALGVDAVVHQTTIENGGKTIAVLGSGVDCCTPGENIALYNSILATGGTIISESPISTLPTKGSFPSRNRIIAGMSLGVLVTEGALDSGSMITARAAFENGRKVFAVPGPITSSLSKGPYELISNGGKLVTTGNEILEELHHKSTSPSLTVPGVRKSIKGETIEEQRIIDLLAGESLHFDELVKNTKFNSSQMGSVLSMMEMKGMIKNLGSGVYCLTE